MVPCCNAVIGISCQQFQIAVCVYVLSPGALIATEGHWLTGSEVDAVQILMQSEWSGHSLMSVTLDFTTPVTRPFIQVKLPFHYDLQAYILYIYSTHI